MDVGDAMRLQQAALDSRQVDRAGELVAQGMAAHRSRTHPAHFWLIAREAERTKLVLDGYLMDTCRAALTNAVRCWW
jgi:hypothetical protein